MYERPKKLSAILTKRIMDQHKICVNIEPSRKQTTYDTIQEGDTNIQRKNNKTISTGKTHIQIVHMIG